MNETETQKEFQVFLKENNINFKLNPNKYPIIDKWNYKYKYMPNRRIIYEKIEELINKQINSLFKEGMNRVLKQEVNADEKNCN